MARLEALNLLQCNVQELAEMLNISSEAVYKWDSQKIPLAREYQIRDLAAGRTPLLDNRNQKSPSCTNS